MSATRQRRTTALYDDIAAHLRAQLEDAAEVVRQRDSLIRELRRQNHSLSSVRQELIDERNALRARTPNERLLGAVRHILQWMPPELVVVPCQQQLRFAEAQSLASQLNEESFGWSAVPAPWGGWMPERIKP